MTFKPDIEFQPLDVIKRFQEKKLKEVLSYTNEKSK